jgi:dethiobiotin synthetase
MTAFFVTGTGTDIGKTFVTAGLVRHLRATGRSATALKPVASGFTMSAAASSDPGMLLTALGETVNEGTIARISPWRFAAPLSPDMAAAREGRAIDFDALTAYCRAAMRDAAGVTFIEGVGGIMVPLDGIHTVLDWIVALEIPVILVAGAYLGTISHTLSALDTLDRRGLRPAALIVNDTGDGPVPLEETRATLVRFAGGVPCVALGWGENADFAGLWQVVAGGRAG